MLRVHVMLSMRTTTNVDELTEFFRTEFLPAISVQPGYVGARLGTADPAPGDLYLDMDFESGDDQQAWAATPAHAEVVTRLRTLVEPIGSHRYSTLV
jgi:hypothetical protein